MGRLWVLVAGVAAVVGLAACPRETFNPAGPGPADAGDEASTGVPPNQTADGSVQTSNDAGGTMANDDSGTRATACTAAPFVTLGATVNGLDVNGTTKALSGATIGFTSCTGYYVTTGANGTATTQITEGIALSPFYNGGVTMIGGVGAELPATGNVSTTMTLFGTGVGAAIPGFEADGGTGSALAIVLQVDAAATAPCTAVSGVTLAVTGHPEAVVSYAGADWPVNAGTTTAESAGPYVFVSGVTGATKIAVTGAKSGCSVKLVTASQTGNFILLQGAVTVGIATITN